MMLMHLSALSFDLDGHVTISPGPGTDIGDMTRRTNKVKTLDGGVAMNDAGFSWGDLDSVLIWTTRSREYEGRVGALVRNHGTLRFSNDRGIFLATPERYSVSAGESRLTLSITAKLNP